MNAIVLMLVLGVAVWIWQANLRHREAAILHCRRLCREMELQLLDQTIALASISVGRNRQGRLQLRRRYSFEVSTDGVTRCKGYLVLHGLVVTHMEIDMPDGALILQGKDLITYH